MRFIISFVKTLLLITALSFIPFVRGCGDDVGMTQSVGFPLPLAQKYDTADIPLEMNSYLHFWILGNVIIMTLIISTIPEYFRSIILRKRTFLHIFFAGALNDLLSLPVFIVSILVTGLFESIFPGTAIVIIDMIPRLFFILFLLLVNLFEQKVLFPNGSCFDESY